MCSKYRLLYPVSIYVYDTKNLTGYNNPIRLGYYYTMRFAVSDNNKLPMGIEELQCAVILSEWITITLRELQCLITPSDSYNTKKLKVHRKHSTTEILLHKVICRGQ